MIDLVRGVLIALAMSGSIRARYIPGVLAATACAALFLVEVLLPFVVPLRPLPQEIGYELAFGSLFFGPSAFPNALTCWLAPVLASPLHQIVPAGVAAGAARRAFRAAEPLHPDSAASRALDRAGLRLLAVSVVAALLSVAGLLGTLVGPR